MNRKYSAPKNSKARGFTIPELIIVLAVVAMLIMIAVPNYNRIIVNGNLKTAASDMIADFYTLREKAMAGDQQFDLTFNVDNNLYTVNPASGLPNGWKSPASIASDIYLDPATSLETVSFYPRGTLSQNGSVVLRNSRNSTARITSYQTGKTDVQYTWD